MRPPEPQSGIPAAVRPRWNEMLRALREARGVTQDGWGARLGVSRKTVQRWENGERAPDPTAEAAIVAYCREAALFRAYDRGPLAGMTLTPDLLQDLLTEARWRVSGASRPAAVAMPAPAQPAAINQATVPQPVEPPNNLPVPLTSFVGRERELGAVRRLQAGTRLLTLAGPGGSGKTRLVLELARELRWAYPHGVLWVELAALTDPALAPDSVAAALGITPSGTEPATSTVVEALRPRHSLLVLDNCEHLLSACAALTEALLRACPALEVIVTSREPLGIAGEVIWRVPPLALPGDVLGVGAAALPAFAAIDAVRLFVERARLHRPGFALTAANAPAVAEICRRLDGMPLAIELAAARVRTLAAEQIAERLSDRLRLLTGGGRTALPRQQTLRAALDWSHDLLSPEEQALLHRLSVFAGGFSLEAAEAAGGAPAEATATAEDVLDLLARLVDKSLVIAEEVDGSVRYRLLETVRQYAAEHLAAAGEADSARDRHLGWCLELALAAEPELRGPRASAWLAVLEREHDNLRTALAWALERGETERALRLAGALPRFWELHGHLTEGRAWLARVLDAAGPHATRAAEGGDGNAPGAEDTLTHGYAWALHRAGDLAYKQGDYAAARSLFEQALALHEELGDQRGIAEAQGNLGRTAVRRGEFSRAVAYLEDALALHTRLDHAAGVADVRFMLGVVALRRADYAGAREQFEACLMLQRKLGNKEGIANALEELATVMVEESDDPDAVARAAVLMDECLALYRDLGNKGGIAVVLGHNGMQAWASGEYERAQALLAESLALYREVGDRRGIARLLGNQATLALYQRDYARAAALSRESFAIYREIGDAWAVGRFLPVLASVVYALRQPARAVRLFATAEAIRAHLGVEMPPIVRPAVEATVNRLRGLLPEPEFAAAWQAGRSLTLDAALDLALTEAASIGSAD